MEIELDDVKLSFVEWLYLKDHEVIDIMLGAVITNRFNGPDALNLQVIGPPSNTKTELLRSLSECRDIYTVSSLTPQTFLSGMKGKQKSLLIKLKDMGKRIVVIKDLTTILEMRSESRQEIFSQLREIADGYISRDYGTGKREEWKGKLGILCAVTNIIDNHQGHHHVLGERFLSCRLSNDNPRAMAEQAKKIAGKEIKMRQQLQEVVKQFLEQFSEPNVENIRIPGETEQKLINLACFIAKSRTGVPRDRYTQTVEFLPEAEGPARLMKQLWILGAGIAVVQGKNELDEDIYKILKRIAINSIPKHRSIILQGMWDSMIMSADWELTRAIGKMFNIPTETIKRYLEDLWMLGLLKRKIEGEENEEDESWKHKKTPYSWQLSSECIDLIEQSQIFLNDGNLNE